jgi:hypothetical protein
VRFSVGEEPRREGESGQAGREGAAVQVEPGCRAGSSANLVLQHLNVGTAAVAGLIEQPPRLADR